MQRTANSTAVNQGGPAWLWRMAPCGSVERVVKSLLIRGDRVPDDAVVVIRAGVMTAASVEQAAERTFDLYGVLGISVEAALDQTVIEACRSSDRLAPYRQIRSHKVADD